MKQACRALSLLIIVLAISCQGTNTTTPPSSNPKQGGRLVAAQLAGPKTFNFLYEDDNETLTVLGCLNATLMRINRKTQQVELDLAESASWAPDGRTLTMRLRPGLKFSDGRPLTADDVVFTFQVIYDPKLSSSVADTMKVGGKPFQVEKVDDATVRITMASAYAAVDRLFDIVYVLPKHVLESSYREGKFEQAWGINAPPQQVVGTGPFRLQAYEPGQRTVLVKNPHYFKRDGQGNALPYLDEIDLQIVGDKSTQLLKFQQGELDVVYPITNEQVQTLRPLVQQGQVETIDLGPSLIAELLWFNLNPGQNPQTKKPYVDPIKLKWFSQPAWRRAIATAIDKAAIVDAAFFGKATILSSPISPGETQWHHSQLKPYPYDPNQAGTMLSQIGLIDRNGDGVREDEQGHPIKFTLITNAENAIRRKIGQMVQEDLRKVGIEVNFAPVESKTLLSTIQSGFDYEACLFSLAGGDTDPDAKTNFLLSGGNIHYWYPQQKTPATPWEAEIDQLMAQEAKTLDKAERKKLFDRVQQILAEQVPVIPLVARNLLVAARTRVGNLKPGILYDFVLWNSEELFLQ